MSDVLNATSIAAMPLEIERLKRSKTWRLCRSHPFLAYYVVSLWLSAFHGIPAGSLEDDNEILAELAGCSPLEWVAVRPLALHGWQKREDGRLYHPIVEAKARESLQIRVSVARSKSNSRIIHKSDDTFDAWYAEYPRKVGIGAARRAYASAIEKCGADVLLEAVKRFARQCETKDIKFVAHPSTWLNQERWKDGKNPQISVADAAMISTSPTWNGKAQKLASLIGNAAFNVWFGRAELREPSTIIFPTESLRRGAEQFYPSQIRRVLGDYCLEVGNGLELKSEGEIR